jgi:hypothetical protein
MSYANIAKDTWGGITRGTGDALKSYAGTGFHKAGAKEAREFLGLGKGMSWMGRALGGGFAAYSMYQGYKKEGAWGATKALGETALQGYAWGVANYVAGGVLSSGLAVGAGAVAGGALGSMAAGINPLRFITRPLASAHAAKQARVNMGTPVVDQFGTVSTMRQRSLQAIQNSKVNGRNALGNEAGLMYSPYMR